MRKVLLSFILLITLSNAYPTYGDRVHISYSKGYGYDAIIQDIRGDRLLVKVIDVQLKNFFIIQLNPTTCSGNEELRTGDRKLIWIPKYCID